MRSLLAVGSIAGFVLGYALAGQTHRVANPEPPTGSGVERAPSAAPAELDGAASQIPKPHFTLISGEVTNLAPRESARVSAHRVLPGEEAETWLAQSAAATVIEATHTSLRFRYRLRVSEPGRYWVGLQHQDAWVSIEEVSVGDDPDDPVSLDFELPGFSPVEFLRVRASGPSGPLEVIDLRLTTDDGRHFHDAVTVYAYSPGEFELPIRSVVRALGGILDAPPGEERMPESVIDLRLHATAPGLGVAVARVAFTDAWSAELEFPPACRLAVHLKSDDHPHYRGRLEVSLRPLRGRFGALPVHRPESVPCADSHVVFESLAPGPYEVGIHERVAATTAPVITRGVEVSPTEGSVEIELPTPVELVIHAQDEHIGHRLGLRCLERGREDWRVDRIIDAKRRSTIPGLSPGRYLVTGLGLSTEVDVPASTVISLPTTANALRVTKATPTALATVPLWPGDVLLTANARPIRSHADLNAAVHSVPLGGTVEFELLREGRRKVVRAEIDLERRRLIATEIATTPFVLPEGGPR